MRENVRKNMEFRRKLALEDIRIEIEKKQRAKEQANKTQGKGMKQEFEECLKEYKTREEAIDAFIKKHPFYSKNNEKDMEMFNNWAKDISKGPVKITPRPKNQMFQTMNSLLKQYDKDEDIIGLWVSMFEDKYVGEKDIEEFAKDLLDEVRKGIGSR